MKTLMSFAALALIAAGCSTTQQPVSVAEKETSSSPSFVGAADGFTIVNKDGDYAFREIAIFGSTLGT